MARFLAAVLAVALLSAARASAANAAAPTIPLATALRTDLQTYLKTRKTPEHVSAASLSVSLPNGKFVDVAAGTTAYGGGAAVTPSNLFQIGSNTKAFTGVLIVKLQSAGKLKTSDTLGKYLPQYATWKGLSITQLLDMTSGLDTYDNTPAWQKAIVADPYHFFSDRQLVGFINPDKPMMAGWNYSNTGYILASMIAEKVSSGTSYTNLLRNLVIAPTKIADLYYYPNIYPSELRQRTVQGYFYNRDSDSAGLAPFLGKSVRDYSASWTQAAGGIVSTPHALAAWARKLYTGPMLTDLERRELETMVSKKTGEPLAEATADEPFAFGLGVAQIYKSPLGRVWFYEGETLGYRMVHVYFPEKDVAIAFGVNSSTSGKEDRAGELIVSISQTLKKYGLL